jgi:hypothetical protein
LWQGDIAQIEDLRNQIGSKQRGAGRATIVCLINESGVGGFCAIAPCKNLLFSKTRLQPPISKSFYWAVRHLISLFRP